MPWLVDRYNRYKPQGLEIVGVSMDDVSQGEEVARFTKEMNVNLNYTILLGNESVGNAYGGVLFLPQTLFIGRDGKIIKSTFGIQSKSTFEDGIKQSFGAAVH